MRAAILVPVLLLGCANQRPPAPHDAPAPLPAVQPSASVTAPPSRPPLGTELPAVLAEGDAGPCGPRLLGLVMSEMDGLDQSREVFPHIGELRPRLLRCQNEPAWTQEDRRKLSAAKWARMWLAMWGDPADDAVVERFLTERSDFAHKENGIEADSAQQAMAAWVEQHFRREGFPDPGKRTANHWALVTPPQGGRALGMFQVHYRHWGYAIQVVLVERNAHWVVRMSLPTQTWHYDD